jgi:hypothetical protein
MESASVATAFADGSSSFDIGENDYDYHFDNILEDYNEEDNSENPENCIADSSDGSDDSSGMSNDGHDSNVEMEEANKVKEGKDNTGIATRLSFLLIIFFRILFHFRISKNAMSKILAFISFMLGKWASCWLYGYNIAI